MPVFRRPFDFALRQRRPPPTPSSVGTVYNVTEANWFFSPGTWVKNGTTYAETNNPGAYCKFAFNGTGLAVGLDLSHWAIEGTASRFPHLRWRVDGGAWQEHLTTNGQTSQVLASGLSDGAHAVELYFRAVSLNTFGLSRWEPPLFSLRLTSATVTAGVLTAPTLKTGRWLIFGDSLVEGTNALANTYTGAGQDASNTWGHQTAFALDAEVGIIGFVVQGWDIQGGGGGGGTSVPRLHQPGGEQAWDKHWQGQSRSFTGIEAVFVNTGANDGLQGSTDAAVESAVEDFLADFRAANASIPLYLIIPFGALKRSAIKQAYLDYQAGASDSLAFLVDVSWQDATLLASLDGDNENSSSTYSHDDIHPNQAGHDRIAVLLGAALAAGDDPTVTTQAISSITATTATGNGTVTQEGYAPVTERGVVLNTTGTPTTSDLKFVAGTAGPGAFTASLTGLDVDTHYYARAYAINLWGTSYGAEVEFDTATPAEIILSPSTHITASGENTTARLTAPSGKTTSDFQVGRIQDDENPADSINLTADKYTELEWAIEFTSAASGAYEFRVTNAGTPLDTYTETPELSVAESVELVVSNVEHGHTAEEPTLVQQYTLTVAAAEHAHTSETLALVQQFVLVVADSEHAHASEAVALIQQFLLSVSDATHLHTAELVDLFQAYLLSVADAEHGHTAETVALLQAHLLTVADVTHAHTVENVTISPDVEGDVQLVVADVAHAHTSENVALTQNYVLTVDDVTHSHESGNVDLIQQYELTVADSTHVHGSENVALVQQYNIVVADAEHSHEVANVALTQNYVLIVQDVEHLHESGSPSLVQQYVLAVQDAEHLHESENAGLVQQYVLSVANVEHVHESENVTISPDIAGNVTLVVQNVTHAHGSEDIILAHQFVVTVQGVEHSHVVDNVEVSLQFTLAVDGVAHLHSSENSDLVQQFVLAVNNASHLHSANNVVLSLDGAGGSGNKDVSKGVARGMHKGLGQ